MFWRHELMAIRTLKAPRMYSFWHRLVFKLGSLMLLVFAISKLAQESAMTSSTMEPYERTRTSVIKTIKSMEGDMIDCVDIHEQPAFSHPLLRDHKIQMNPEFPPKQTNSSNNPRIWKKKADQEHRRCPVGTIPMMKTTMNKDSTWKPEPPITTGTEKNRTSSRPKFQRVLPHEHAVVYTRGENYFGAKASINVWNPKVEARNEFSLAQIWVLSEGHLNSIEAGWTVHPALYGDTKTRFFVFWTSDHYGKIGCYNLMCPGFIQTNNDVPINFALEPVSSYAGPQYYIDVEIFLDKSSRNWWLFVQGKQMGYWPGELLPALATGATMIEWGGEVVNAGGRRRHTATEMGSGRFPEEGFQKSGYFRDVKVVDASHTYIDPSLRLAPLVERPNCYDVRVFRHGEGEAASGGRRRRPGWGSSFFYFGGPGRSVSCP